MDIHPVAIATLVKSTYEAVSMQVLEGNDTATTASSGATDPSTYLGLILVDGTVSLDSGIHSICSLQEKESIIVVIP